MEQYPRLFIRLKSDIPLRRTSPILADGSCLANLSGREILVPAVSLPWIAASPDRIEHILPDLLG